jgi:hypothetical protein
MDRELRVNERLYLHGIVDQNATYFDFSLLCGSTSLPLGMFRNKKNFTYKITIRSLILGDQPAPGDFLENMVAFSVKAWFEKHKSKFGSSETLTCRF